MITESQIMPELLSVDQAGVQAVILLVENSGLALSDKPYYEKICGKAMFEYVMDACEGFNTKIAVLNERENPLAVARQFLTDEEITLVLFSDTPLITKEVLNDYISKLILQKDDVVIMPRGFVFKTKKLRTTEKIDLPPKSLFDKNEFFAISNFFDLENAIKYINSKIVDKHIQNGVYIENKQLVKIDQNVEIEKGAKILSFSQILGSSFIGSGAIISASIVKNSKVEEQCEIVNCTLCNSIVNAGVKLKPYTFLNNEEFKGE